jgi:hypothetical protein
MVFRALWNNNYECVCVFVTVAMVILLTDIRPHGFRALLDNNYECDCVL